MVTVDPKSCDNTPETLYMAKSLIFSPRYLHLHSLCFKMGFFGAVICVFHCLAFDVVDIVSSENPVLSFKGV